MFSCRYSKLVSKNECLLLRVSAVLQGIKWLMEFKVEKGKSKGKMTLRDYRMMDSRLATVSQAVTADCSVLDACPRKSWWSARNYQEENMGTKQETAFAQIILHQHLQKQWKGQQGRLRHGTAKGQNTRQTIPQQDSTPFSVYNKLCQSIQISQMLRSEELRL